jgi:hypothetical protein
MTPRDMLKQLCAGRIAFGGSALIAPRLLGSTWVGDAAAPPGFGVIARAFGIRDLGLGVGTFQALQSGNRQALRTWLIVGLAADAVDLGATIAARDKLPSRAVPMLALLAGSAIVTQALNLSQGDPPAPTQA